MTGVDRYLDRRFDRVAYNCLHFARDVWRDTTGVDIGEQLSGLFNPDTRRPVRRHLRSFRRVDHPVDPCLVLMQGSVSDTHIGVYLRGSVLHIHEGGVEFLPVGVASRGFQSVRFYTC